MFTMLYVKSCASNFIFGIPEVKCPNHWIEITEIEMGICDGTNICQIQIMLVCPLSLEQDYLIRHHGKINPILYLIE